MDRWMRMHLPWRRAMTVAVATGVAVPLLGQLVPPFHVLTHEFTQLFTVVAAAVSFFLAAHLAGGAARERGVSAPARMSAALTVAVTAAGVMGLLAFLVMLAANALGPHCRVADGALFYWVTWPPAVALTAVLGVVLGEQRWRWPWLLAVLGGLALVSLLHDGLQAMWGPQIVDLFVAAARQGDVVEQAHAMGARAVWFQPGTENPPLEERARELGLEVVSGKCTMAEHRRLFGGA